MEGSYMRLFFKYLALVLCFIFILTSCGQSSNKDTQSNIDKNDTSSDGIVVSIPSDTVTSEESSNDKTQKPVSSKIWLQKANEEKEKRE